MDNYYKKVRKKSISSILIGIVISGVSIYMIWEYTLGPKAYADDHIHVTVFGCVMLLLGIFMLYSSLQSVQILKKNMKKAGVSEAELAEDLGKGSEFTFCNIGKRYALNCDGRPDVILLEGALVVYQYVEVTRKNGYTSYKYNISVTERSGNEKWLKAKDEIEMEKMFNSIMEIVPYAITENDSTVKGLRKKHLPELIRIVEQRKANYEADKAGV